MNKAVKLVLTLTAMLAAGCSDNTVAPKASSSSDATIPGGGATAALTGTDTLRFTFVIDPDRATSYPLGAGNTITFPAGSLCDPSRSTYGPTEWDKPCMAARYTVTVNTKAWLDADGLPHLDFDKAVRFVPTSNPAGWVMLSVSSYGASVYPWTKIEYCSSASHCVDESIADPSVATVTNPYTGKLSRRVKHFSGYSLTSGAEEGGMESAFSKVSLGTSKP